MVGESGGEDLFAAEDLYGPLADEEPGAGEGEAVAIAPLQVAAGRCYCSTGYTAGGLEQCRFAWRAVRVTAAEPPERFVRAQFLFSDDGYWDWWSSNEGRAGAVTARPLIHVCTERPCPVVDLPGTCTELVHVTDGAEFGPAELRRMFAECQEVNPDAAWPTAVLGPLAVAPPARRVAAPKPQAGPPPGPRASGAPPGRGPFDDLPEGAPSPRGTASELDAEEPGEAGALQARVAVARERFEDKKRPLGDVNLDGFPVGAEAAGAAPAKKRSFGDLLVERAAKLRGPAADGAPRGSKEPAPDRAPPASGIDGGMREFAQALLMAIREGKDAAASELSGDGLGSTDPAGVPRDLATKRAFCRRMAANLPGRLTELSLQQMADFLGSHEGSAAVDATGPIALRYLLTIYLPQHPVREIGVQTYRELRTLAEAVDLLMQGKAAHACDLIVQRLKALQVATTDGSWAAAKWLELIPPRDEPTAIRSEEEELIRGIQLGEMKPYELAARLASAKSSG